MNSLDKKNRPFLLHRQFKFDLRFIFFTVDFFVFRFVTICLCFVCFHLQFENKQVAHTRTVYRSICNRFGERFVSN